MTAAIMYQYCHKTIAKVNTERWLFEQFTIWFEAFWTSAVTAQSFHVETFKVWQRTSTVSTTALRGILADLSHGMTGYFLEAFEQQKMQISA